MEMVAVRAASITEALRQVELDDRRIKVKAIETLWTPFTVTPIG